jgi:hypothetical protein
MVIFVYASVFIGLIFWRLGDNVDGLRNRMTLLYSQAQLFLLMVGARRGARNGFTWHASGLSVHRAAHTAPWFSRQRFGGGRGPLWSGAGRGLAWVEWAAKALSKTRPPRHAQTTRRNPSPPALRLHVHIFQRQGVLHSRLQRQAVQVGVEGAAGGGNPSFWGGVALFCWPGRPRLSDTAPATSPASAAWKHECTSVPDPPKPPPGQTPALPSDTNLRQTPCPPKPPRRPFSNLHHTPAPPARPPAPARPRRVSAYYAAKTVAVLPFVLANVGASTLLVYGMAALRPDPLSIAAHCAACGLCYMVAQQVQALATILTPNQVRGGARDGGGCAPCSAEPRAAKPPRPPRPPRASLRAYILGSGGAPKQANTCIVPLSPALHTSRNPRRTRAPRPALKQGPACFCETLRTLRSSSPSRGPA